MEKWMVVLVAAGFLIPYGTVLAVTGNIHGAEYVRQQEKEAAGKYRILLDREENGGYLSLEEYLPSVLAAQISPDSEMEALKAQAVIARTYIRRQMGEEKEILLTQEGYDKLEQELDTLKTEKRAEISERIKIALGFGDLSENSEYDEAKNAQAANETKIAELENKLRYAKIIDESEIDTKTVQVGNTVKVLDIEFNEEVSYTIVGSTEVNLAENKISNESPIGKALLGAKKNQTIDVQAPAGIMKYKILAITK